LRILQAVPADWAGDAAGHGSNTSQVGLVEWND